MVYEPYNNTLEYFPLMGQDCSFLIPFAGATRISTTLSMIVFVGMILTFSLHLGDD
ncbi:hypothetical protein PHMEG_00011168 [Phytophthora megakarya]|uniref:Uncharacterized protein n=1 Tax=Phytophthora megakarya TaxID=4795 RepID=A0A225WBX3_9STRA|nr:hypothetical protein PHMEG_00011168 [Phytophthora megakarya]